MTPRRVVRGIRRRLQRLTQAGVERGLPPAWFGYRWVRRETVPQHFAHSHGAQGARKARGARGAGRYETVHPETVARNPLPCNVARRDELPADRGWWGYSFRDVPARTSAETFIATIPDCRIVSYRDPAKGGDFYPAILTSDEHALDLREVRFRPSHAQALRSGQPTRIPRATWVIERVYHNHSHWLTAHLPKILLLQQRGELDDVLLPGRRTPAIDGSLRMLGLDPQRFPTFDDGRVLQVDRLTVVGTDRFRPELLRLVQDAFARPDASPPHRRVYISRAKAARRRLVNEEQIWPSLQEAGFERVFMEDLSFEQQVRLMRQTAVLCAPHGAGLTNMLFCPRGLHVLEIADLGFPNPNFYALASALGHRYWLLAGEAVGEAHPLERDLRVDPALIPASLERLRSSG